MANTTPRIGVVTSGNVPANMHAAPIILVNPDGTSAGTVKKQAAQVDSVAADVATLKTDFNALLAKLRAAGVIS